MSNPEGGQTQSMKPLGSVPSGLSTVLVFVLLFFLVLVLAFASGRDGCSFCHLLIQTPASDTSIQAATYTDT